MRKPGKMYVDLCLIDYKVASMQVGKACINDVGYDMEFYQDSIHRFLDKFSKSLSA